jgi:hypothetical protein
MITIRDNSFTLASGNEERWPYILVLDNGVEIECLNKIGVYIELVDRVIVNICNLNKEYYLRESKENEVRGHEYYVPPTPSEIIHNNIFCYNKIDGSLKWQVESKEGSPYVDLYLKMSRKVKCEIHYKNNSQEDDWGITLKEEFRKGEDRIEARTFGCNGYEIDIETGKVKFLYQGK